MHPNQKVSDEDILAAYSEAGSYYGAAKLLGVSKQAVMRRHKRLAGYDERMAADATRSEVDPGMLSAASETGLSLDTARHGWRRVQREDGGFDSVFWKQEEESELQNKADLILETMLESIEPVDPMAAPERRNADLCVCYVLSDAHIGMLAFEEETGGDNWDTKIAEETLTRWINAAIQSVPDAHTGLLIQLGDWLHFDGMVPETPTSKHSLDTDTRFQLLVRVAIRTLRRVVSLMLEKHEHVHVIMADANHDPASGAWLREMFQTLYENEPRITIDTSADTYYAYRWGDVSVFAHHGHKAKIGSLSSIFAGKFRELYGKTTYSYAHVGHLHHKAVKEDTMMITEQHSTLAAPDAYAAKGGYISKRGASTIIYHKKFGEVGRTTIRPEMLK